MNEGGPILRIWESRWLRALRDVTNATNARSVIGAPLPESGAGHTSTLLDFQHARAVATSLVLANMNSLPFDWATRLSVGGTHLSHFIVKQLPVLPPEVYLERSLGGREGILWVELIVSRVVELTYTANDLSGFAEDIGYDGPPFPWNTERRHHVQCELDAIYAHMYRLSRSELEWILDAPPPSSSFPSLKQHEMKEFGEYRTERLALAAFDSMERGIVPDLYTETGK